MLSAPDTTTDGLRAQALGLGSGGLMMTFFGLAWWGSASQGVADRGQPLYSATIGGIALALAVASLVLLRAARHVPRDTSPAGTAPGRAVGRRVGRRYGLIFGLEIAAIVVASVIVHRLNHAEYFFPLLAIIVGAHFLPLAPLFGLRAYYATGVALCLAGLLVLVGTPSTALMGSTRVWDALPGLLCGPILWLTAIYDLLLGRQALMEARKLLGCVGSRK